VTRVPSRRPKLVWVVFLFVVFSAGYTLLSFLLFHAGVIAGSPEQAAYIRSMSAFDYALTLGVAGLNIAAAVSLFLLTKVAFYLFVTALVLSLGWTMVQVAQGRIPASAIGVGMLLGYAV
jgi:hypothetical protein